MWPFGNGFTPRFPNSGYYDPEEVDEELPIYNPVDNFATAAFLAASLPFGFTPSGSGGLNNFMNVPNYTISTTPTINHDENVAQMAPQLFPSQLHVANKVELDARAAELKEKLLKSRTLKDRPSTISDTPGLMASTQSLPQQPLALDQAPFNATNENSSKAAASNVAPHPLPRKPTQSSIPADESDITALITSISGQNTADRNPSVKTQPKHKENQTDALPASGTLPPTTNSSHMEINVVHQPIQALPRSLMSLKAEPTPCEMHSPPEEGEISSNADNPVEEDMAKKEPRKANQDPQKSWRRYAQKAQNEAKATKVLDGQVDTGSNPSKDSDERPFTGARRDSCHSHCHPSVRELFSDLSHEFRHDRQNKRHVPREQRDAHRLTPREPSQDTWRDSRHLTRRNSRHEVPSSREVPVMPGLSTNSEAPTATTTPESELTSILERDSDLRDWLILTDYYDKDMRTKKLDRYRKKAELDQKKAEVDAALRKLQEEEEIEIITKRSAGAPAPSTLQTPVLENRELAPKQSNLGPVKSIPAKREHEGDEGTDRQSKALSKVPRTWDTSRCEVGDMRSIAWRNADGFPDRGCSSRRDYVESSYRYGNRSPPRYLRGDDDMYPRDRSSHRYHGGYDDREYQRESSQGRDRFHSTRPDQGRLDLGRRGDTRFFIVKSFNEDNVLKCMQDGIWVTQVDNGTILNSAFAKCRNVVLVFSINQSKAFQGYVSSIRTGVIPERLRPLTNPLFTTKKARMETAPSADTPRSPWMKNIHWETSHPFRLDWVNTTGVHFSHVSHLKNRFNEDLPVLVGRDGQEIEEECARELLIEMEKHADGYSAGTIGGALWNSPIAYRGKELGVRRRLDTLRKERPIKKKF